MNDIKFFALGGLGEDGKNFYLLQINKSYFIIDAGLKYPNISLYGIDSMISDYYKLEDIKDQIKGVFLSSSLESHLGALPYLIQDFNLPIYASYFTMQVVKTYFQSHKVHYKNLNLNVVKSEDIIHFDDVAVSFFATSQLVPETLGISFQTERGAIVYTGDLKFLEFKNKFFQTNFTSLSHIAQQKVLTFLPSSQGAFNNSHNNEDDNFEYKLNNYFINYALKPQGIIVIASLALDLLKIQIAIDLACKLNFKISFLGLKNEKIIDVALKKNFLKVPSFNLVELNNFEDQRKHKQLVVFVFGKHFATLQRLQQMSKQNDRVIHLTNQDLVLLMSKEMAGIAKMQSQTLDILSRNHIKAYVLVKDLSICQNNYEKNLKIMLNLLKPKYIIPVIGEYRHQYQVKKIAQKIGFKPYNIFLLENGSIWNCCDTQEPFVEHNHMTLGEILIDGTPVVEGQDFIMKDRELLAADGVVIVVANVNARYKKIVGEPQLVSKGFLAVAETNHIFPKLKEIFNEKSIIFLKKKYLKWNDFKKNIRESLGKFLFKETKKRPIVIPIFISVKSE
ncbi:ribonuclease J ['Fragaria x ananassa' phyllody phytoplasma]|uniref:Ribonuclease J n=1 Tax='Fragaria x ananassa' phyllody phytoplasma TaxID=2358428 RepID=A0ABS5K3A8_9MOLU|nr:ribonuclease J ['Fragaria x ananassa' phyllody phytoplasma]MBS2126254.1 ribonuclease J ['Fragaria x ananassa' phyllody phytoplasma]